MKKILALLLLSSLVGGQNTNLDKDRILYCLEDGEFDDGEFWYLQPLAMQMINARNIWEIESFLEIVRKEGFPENSYFTVNVFAWDFKQDGDSISAFEHKFRDEIKFRKENNMEDNRGWMKINTRNLTYHYKQYWYGDTYGSDDDRVYDTYGQCTKYSDGLNLEKSKYLD